MEINTVKKLPLYKTYSSVLWIKCFISPKFPDESFDDSVQRLKSESYSSLPSPLSF